MITKIIKNGPYCCSKVISMRIPLAITSVFMYTNIYTNIYQTYPLESELAGVFSRIQNNNHIVYYSSRTIVLIL